nr:acyl carrier protein [uncultured Carboxylicivirga sp.]
MKVDEFITVVREELEVEDQELNIDTKFDTLDIWDSVARLVLISLVDEKFQMQIKADDFKSIGTLDDLMALIGKDKFEA